MLTTREAAQRLGVSLRTVQLWVEADILPAARTPGGHRRIPYNAVEALALSTGLGGEPTVRSAYRTPEVRRKLDDDVFVAPPSIDLSKQALDVLLVTQEDEQQESYKRAMSPYGRSIQLRFAETGYLALLQIGQRTPDLLVTHLDLPGMDGMAMLRTLERCESISNMHVLVLTEQSEQEIARKGGVPRGAEVMQLPASAEAVAVRVGQWLLERRTS